MIVDVSVVNRFYLMIIDVQSRRAGSLDAKRNMGQENRRITPVREMLVDSLAQIL